MTKNSKLRKIKYPVSLESQMTHYPVPEDYEEYRLFKLHHQGRFVEIDPLTLKEINKLNE